VDLAQTVRDVLRLTAHSIPANVRINQSVDADSPIVVGDPTQMQQVFLNLVVNAGDAMPDGGRLSMATGTCVLGKADCHARPNAKAGAYVRVSVSDTGQGVPEAIQDRIFEPFFTTKGPGQGTGMGLAMVYGIVRNHGGWIELDSARGRGATFHVYLPAAPTAQGATATRQAHAPESLQHDYAHALRGARAGERGAPAVDVQSGLPVDAAEVHVDRLAGLGAAGHKLGERNGQAYRPSSE
jgi:two-component system, cell cycle sensor histidine kinase and response regulator CckA